MQYIMLTYKNIIVNIDLAESYTQDVRFKWS